MKTRIMKFTALLFGLIFVFSLFPQSAAAVVWSDDFDDGNYDGWTVELGDFLVTDGELLSQSGDNVRMIWHASSQTVGTWSFDHWHPTHTNIHTQNFIFLASGDVTPSPAYSGYGIRITECTIFLIRYDEGTSVSLAFTILETFYETWTHYDITRNTTGGFHVYANATSTTAEPNLVVVDTTYDISDKFLLREGNYGNTYPVSRIDNITVDDEILITPPEPTTTETTTTSDTTTTETTTVGDVFPIDTTLLLAGAGVVGVIIIVAVVFTRRR